MPDPTAPDIMTAIATLLGGLTQNIQQNRQQSLQALSLLAQQPGMYVTPAHAPESAGLLRMLLGAGEYLPEPTTGAPVVRYGGTPLTVSRGTAGPSTLDFLKGLLAPAPPTTTEALRPVAETYSTPEGQTVTRAAPAAPSPVKPLQPAVIPTRNFGLTQSEVLTDPEIVALLQSPGDQKFAVAKRMREMATEKVSRAKELRQMQQSGIEQTMKQAELIGRRFLRVTDQASLDQALADLTPVLLPDVLATLPATYSAAAVQQVVNDAQTVKDQTEAARQAAVIQAKAPLETAAAVQKAQALLPIHVAQAGQEAAATEPSRMRVAQATGERAAALQAQAVGPPHPSEQGLVGINPRTGAVTPLRSPTGEPIRGAMTETQGSALAFGIRAKEADTIARQLETKGVLPTLATQAAGGLPAGIGNYLLPAEYQQYNQAKLQFAQAILRKESGAAINRDEYTKVDQTYFPQPGDTAAVLTQKQQARASATHGLELQTGGRTLPGTPLTPTPSGQKRPPREAPQPVPPAPGAAPASISRADFATSLQAENARRSAAGQPLLTEQEALTLMQQRGYVLEGQ